MRLHLIPRSYFVEYLNRKQSLGLHVGHCVIQILQSKSVTLGPTKLYRNYSVIMACSTVAFPCGYNFPAAPNWLQSFVFIQLAADVFKRCVADLLQHSPVVLWRIWIWVSFCSRSLQSNQDKDLEQVLRSLCNKLFRLLLMFGHRQKAVFYNCA